jgi:predicted aldo/keto reductase-like oxidoreductase
LISSLTIGRSGRFSTRIRLSSLSLSQAAQADADKAIHRALIVGLNHVDVAASYSQALAGKLLHGELLDRPKSITHVNIPLGRSEFIHSLSATRSITASSLDPQNPPFSPWVKKHLAGGKV